MKSISSLEQALSVFNNWLDSEMEIAVVFSDGRSGLGLKGKLSDVSSEWLSISGNGDSGNLSLYLPTAKFGSVETVGTEEIVGFAKTFSPSLECVEMTLSGGTRVVIVPFIVSGTSASPLRQ